MALTSADVVTLARFPLALGVAAAALAGGAGACGVAIGLAVAAALTDLVDGWLARRSGTASARGAALDSWADGALAVALLIALVRLVPASEWRAWIVLWVAIIVAIRAVVAVAARLRGRLAIGHGVLNKAAGIAAFVAVVWALAAGSFQPVVTGVALAIATVAAFAEGRSSLASL